jgi:recombination protein RecT
MKLKNTGEIKTFGSQYGVWKTEFESMALKTVTKLNLSNAPLSIEMQRATVADQMVIKVLTPMAVSKEYIDVTATSINQRGNFRGKRI